ncbi:MAG: hypothetical protein BGO14_10270 [Chlamydiales bacterium 38-26]|nr:alpha/beta hydrolase fold domain-containing protein [Chlamydiales bacterium]OJV11348.1 MAG: hypothetical protein BGO14_10270 [Chlamydiales bacterium 38-26]
MISKQQEGPKEDPKKIFIGGSSSGATLSAVVSIIAGDREGSKIRGQILLCPMTDVDFNIPSYHENAVGYNLTREHCIWFLCKYCPDVALRDNPFVASIRALDFNNLPPTIIVTAEFDPLRDEGRAFAKKTPSSRSEVL